MEKVDLFENAGKPLLAAMWYRRALDKGVLEGWKELGDKRLYRNDTSGAIQAYEQSIQFGNLNSLIPLAIVYGHYIPDPAKALELLNEAVTKRVDGAMEEIGQLYLSQKDFANAAAAFEQAYAKDKTKTVRVFLVAAYEGMGRPEKTDALFEEILVVEPEACLDYAYVLKERGDFRGAAQQFENAASINPAYISRAMEMWELAGYPEQADRVFGANTPSPDDRMAYASILAKRGDVAKAIEVLEKEFLKDVRVLAKLVKLCDEHGRDEYADLLLETAVALGQERKGVISALAELYATRGNLRKAILVIIPETTKSPTAYLRLAKFHEGLLEFELADLAYANATRLNVANSLNLRQQAITDRIADFGLNNALNAAAKRLVQSFLRAGAENQAIFAKSLGRDLSPSRCDEATASAAAANLLVALRREAALGKEGDRPLRQRLTAYIVETSFDARPLLKYDELSALVPQGFGNTLGDHDSISH